MSYFTRKTRKIKLLDFPGVHEISKLTLEIKILQQMLQDFQRMFEHFLDTRSYRVEHIPLEGPPGPNSPVNL